MSVSKELPLNKVCVVVGVGEGLGAALARRFAAGYKIALVARGASVIASVADEIAAAGGVALPVQSDATIEAEIAAAHERIGRELGPIEILIYNGGRRPMGRLLETTPEVFEETWRLHTFGAFLWARQLAPQMLERGSGSMLFTGATAGIRPWPNSAAFAPAKFALRGLTQVMARDLHPQRRPRRLCQRGRRNRHAITQTIPPRRKRRGFPQAIRDRRRVLVSRTPGSQRLESRARRQTI